MKTKMLCALVLMGLISAPVYAINAKYRQQLEHSGCTQVSEAQGCDIHKSKEENAKAGFGSTEGAVKQTTSSSYAGNWIAMSNDGATVAKINIDANNKVMVDGQVVKAKKTDGALQFKKGTVLFTIQGDRRVKGEDVWMDTDAGTQGKIISK
ncbi:hypothetical protein [Edaphovirga cremea]|uniref:hypothetical protein n=1 Tax=Edaphovirga cremea TaxID=2267246 RepID=UPI000DEFAFC5|nr:hypothetical protein [Edaphovirga cremea]